MAESQILFAEESYAIRGACFDVYKTHSNGYVESIYQESMEIELQLRGVPFESQVRLGIAYKGLPLRSTFQPDLICFGSIVVELKVAKEITDEHRSQLHNYLKASGLRLGLLANFGHYPGMQIERIIR
jgi:GxxExxY protein